MGRSSRWRSRLVFTIYLVIASLAATEFVGRRLWVTDGERPYHRRHQLFRHDPELGYGLRPGFRIAGDANQLYPGIAIRVDGHGLRGAITEKRPRILLVGDSVAFGFGVAEDEAVSAVLEPMLDGRFAVVNAGVPGYNAQQLRTWTLELVQRLDPRLVILLLNANDAEPRYFRSAGGLTISRYRCYPWEDRERPVETAVGDEPDPRWILPALLGAARQGALFSAYTRARRRTARTEADTPGFTRRQRRELDFWSSGDPVAVDRTANAIEAARNLVGTLHEAGLPVVVARFPWRVAITEALDDPREAEWLDALTDLPGTARVDLSAALRTFHSATPLFLTADGHPSPSGHRAMASSLAQAIHRLRPTIDRDGQESGRP